MAKTIKNDEQITIKRKMINTDGVVEEKEINIGRYYFEASRELKECSIQIYLDEPITDSYEKEQLKSIYAKEYSNFVNDTTIFGWDILDINAENKII